MTTATGLNEEECIKEMRKEYGIPNLARSAINLVRYIHDFQPDYILAMDTGARPIALAVHELYRQIYGPLPTKDRTIRFVKTCGCGFNDSAKEITNNLIEEMSSQGAKKVLCIDELICSGETMNKTKEVFSAFDVKFATLARNEFVEPEPDVCAGAEIYPCLFWGSFSLISGVEYTQSGINLFSSGLELLFRREIIKEARKVAKGALEE